MFRGFLRLGTGLTLERKISGVSHIYGEHPVKQWFLRWLPYTTYGEGLHNTQLSCIIWQGHVYLVGSTAEWE